MLTQEHLKTLMSYSHEEKGLIWIKKTSYRNPVGSKVGHIDKDGYLTTKINYKWYSVHRLTWFYFHGAFPKNQIDHINGDRTDNRIENLRDVTQSENQRNIGLQKNNKTGVTGVQWREKSKKWLAVIRAENKQQYLGSFDNFFEACCARKSAETKYGYHANHGRRQRV